jgi:hypothetical protein
MADNSASYRADASQSQVEDLTHVSLADVLIPAQPSKMPFTAHRATIYRAYLLDCQGRIFFGENVEASDEAAAVVAGRNLVDARNPGKPEVAQGIEIWRGTQLVFRNRLERSPT